MPLANWQYRRQIWSSLDGPALVGFGGDLILAGIAHDGTNRIFVVRFGLPNLEAFGPVLLDKTSPSAPALATDGNRIYLAWRANDPSRCLYFTSGGAYDRWRPSAKLEFSSPREPSLAAGNGLIYMAWTANDVSGQLYHTSFDGTDWGAARRCSESSPIPPSLVFDQGAVHLYGSYGPDSGSRCFDVACRFAGPGCPFGTPLDERSPERPAVAEDLVGGTDYLFLVFRDNAAGGINVLERRGGVWALGPIQVPAETKRPPAAAIVNGRLYVAWTSPDVGQSLNLAFADIR